MPDCEDKSHEGATCALMIGIHLIGEILTSRVENQVVHCPKRKPLRYTFTKWLSA
jgi:hypothetical protein